MGLYHFVCWVDVVILILGNDVLYITLSWEIIEQVFCELVLQIMASTKIILNFGLFREMHPWSSAIFAKPQKKLANSHHLLSMSHTDIQCQLYLDSFE